MYGTQTTEVHIRYLFATILVRDPVADPGGVRGVKSNPPLAHSLVWKIPIWTFTFAQKYLSGNLRTPPRTPLHRILDPPQGPSLKRHRSTISNSDDIDKDWGILSWNIESGKSWDHNFYFFCPSNKKLSKLLLYDRSLSDEDTDIRMPT